MCFQSWIDYYNKREDKCVKDWNHNIANIYYPIQSLAENHNCGVYVCKIIERYVTNQKHSLQFGTTKKDIKNFFNWKFNQCPITCILVFCFFYEKKISLKLTYFMLSF